MAQTTCPLPFLKDHQSTRPLNRGHARRCVKRNEGSQVNDFNLNVFFGQQVSGLKGDVDHRTPRDQRYITTTTDDGGFTEFVRLPLCNVLGNGLGVNALVDVHAPSRQPAAQSVQADVLQHQHRVGKLSTFHEQVVRVLWRTGRHHHQSRVVGKPRFDHVSMKRPRAGASTERNTDGHGTVGTPTPAKHGCVVDKRIEAECRESTKLNLDHRFHAREGSTNAGVNNHRFTQRHVDEFVRMTCIFESHVHPKRSGDFHVFSNEDAVITVHRRHVRHGLLNGSGVSPSAFFGVGPRPFTHFQGSGNGFWARMSTVALKMVFVSISVVKGGHTFSDGFGLGPVHLKKSFSCRLNRCFLFSLHRFKAFFVNAHAEQEGTVSRNRVFCFPIGQQFTVDITGRRTAGIAEVKVVMMMSVPATSHGFHVNQRGPASRHRVFTSNGRGSMPCSGVGSVNGPCREPHSGCFVSPDFHA